MRVLTVGNMYPPLSLGGYELAWQSSVEQLRSRGHEVEVLTTDYGLDAGAAPAGEPGVFRELRWYWRDHECPPVGLRERLAIERHNAATLGRRIDALRPEVVAWWSMGGLSLSLVERVRRAGIPAAAIVCDDWLLYGPQVDAWTRIWRGWRRPLAPLAQRVTGIPAPSDPLAGVGPAFFASDALRRKARKRGVAPATSDVGHRGVERELFTPADRPDWGWRLACVGRIDPRKGIDLAIEALALLPAEATLSIVGGGDDVHLAELRALAAARDVGERVTFHGHRDRDGVIAAYDASDVVVFPVVWQEPWGLVPLEAMARGRPVAATGRGGSAEYLRDGKNCLLFEAEDPAGLAAAVQRLAADPELRERLRNAGFETSGRLTVEAYDEAIERLLLGVAKPG